VTVFQGEAHPLERTRPFGALVEALQLRSGSTDPRRAAIGRLLAAEATVGPHSRPAGALQFRVVEEIIDLLEVLSGQGPVLVALDDLHWADSSTLLTFRWMTRELTEVPVLLIATLRPSPRTAELDLLLDDCERSGAELVALEALEQPDVDALVQAELGLPPGPALADVVGRAGGNPLWVVELVRSMSAEGLLDLTGASAETSGTELPDSLRQLVVRRLGYLPDPTVATLRSASLLGDAFSASGSMSIGGTAAFDSGRTLRTGPGQAHVAKVVRSDLSVDSRFTCPQPALTPWWGGVSVGSLPPCISESHGRWTGDVHVRATTYKPCGAGRARLMFFSNHSQRFVRVGRGTVFTARVKVGALMSSLAVSTKRAPGMWPSS